MGKGNKKSESAVNDGLQTLKKTVQVNTIDTTVNKKENPNQGEGNQKSQVKPVRVTTPPIAPPPPVIEEKDLVQETAYSQTIVHKLEEPIIELVYEITFLEVIGDRKIDKTVYTKDIPLFKEKNVLFISNLFGKENLKEVVLGKREIKASCKRPLEQTEFALDLRNGVLIKTVPEQAWMSSDYESTKKTFDEMVLKAYRELSQQPIKKSNGQNKDNISIDTTGRPRITDF